MKLSVLMVIKGILVSIFGIAFIAVPRELMSLYDVTLEQGGIYMTRLLGAAFILLAIMLLFAKKDTESQALRTFILAVFIGDTIGFVVALLGQLSGFINAFGWVTVALYFLLAIGFGYYYFKKPTAA